MKIKIGDRVRSVSCSPPALGVKGKEGTVISEMTGMNGPDLYIVNFDGLTVAMLEKEVEVIS